MHNDSQILPKRDGVRVTYADFRMVTVQCNNNDAIGLHEVLCAQFDQGLNFSIRCVNSFAVTFCRYT